MRLVIYKTLCSLLGRAALHTGCGGLPGRGDPISAQEAPGRSHTFTSHSRGNGTGCGQAAGHSQGLRNGRNSEPGQGAARAECTCLSVSDPWLSRAFSVQEQLQVPPGAETLGGGGRRRLRQQNIPRCSRRRAGNLAVSGHP